MGQTELADQVSVLSLHCSTIHSPKTWKRPKSPPVNKWVKKRSCVSAYVGRDIIQPWKRRKFCRLENLEDIMLREISQTKEDRYCMTLLTLKSKIVKLRETKCGMVVARGQEVGERKVLVQRVNFVMRWMNSRELMYSKVTIASNSTLYAWNLLIQAQRNCVNWGYVNLIVEIVTQGICPSKHHIV